MLVKQTLSSDQLKKIAVACTDSGTRNYYTSILNKEAGEITVTELRILAALLFGKGFCYESDVAKVYRIFEDVNAFAL